MHPTIVCHPVYAMTRSICCAAILVLAGLATTLIASAAFADPPARVGRISFVDGDVSFYAERAEGWRKARINFPVTSKNSIWINGLGHAEVRVGASALRVDADSILDFTQIDDGRTQLHLQRGTLNVRLRSYPAGEDTGDSETDRETFLVETDEGQVFLQANGRYRFESIQSRNETRVSVFAGLAKFNSPGNALNIEPGKSLIIRAKNGTSSFVFETANESPFDRWAEARDVNWDQTHQRYTSERSISPQMTGYEDLDAFGDWSNDAQYGLLWAPRGLMVGWAPYRYGSWSYVQPWGWTWIDDAAWGFAPFHYGRWVHRQARWYWWPGAYRHRPVYAPALVGWYGGSNWNVSLSIGGGSIGWFPLAPREHFVPQYTSNQIYIRNINNITNNVTVIKPPARFANQAHGGTVVNNGVMINGEPVWRNAGSNLPQTSKPNPAVNPRTPTGSNLGTATLIPPAPPQRARAGAETNPQIRSVTGESPRILSSSPAAIPANRMSVVGEVPHQQPGHAKPAERNAPAGAQGLSVPQQGATNIPPFAKPVKPNPLVVQPAQNIVSPTIQVQGTAPMPRYEAPSTHPDRPGVRQDPASKQNEQRIEGPVRLKERGDRNQPNPRTEQTAPEERKPNSQATDKPQTSGGKVVRERE